jgi:hypothetical protein
VWDAIVAKTTLTRPDWRWTERDFAELWDSADTKIPPAPAVIDQRQNTHAETHPRRLTITRNEMTMRPVHWLWDGRIPLGSLSLLGGREGIGKSTVAYTLAADITAVPCPAASTGSRAASSSRPPKTHGSTPSFRDWLRPAPTSRSSTGSTWSPATASPAASRCLATSPS